MTTLLQQYNISQIITFTILLALATKSVVSFIDWVKDRLNKFFNKEYTIINQQEQIQRRFEHGSEIMHKLREEQQETQQSLRDLKNKLNLLLESDKDDIKSYITRQHHYFCYQKEWIDDFSLDCIEHRYQHYTAEGGNTFIGGFMDQLRKLPKKPPQTK